MDTQHPQTEQASLQTERDSLAKAGRLHWFHWAVVILSGALTIGAWSFTKHQIEENRQSQYTREAAQVVELVRERMLRYEDALWSGVAAIEASGGDMTHSQWHSFAESLQIEEKYQGINGIGVIKRFTAVELAEHIRRQQRTRPNYRVHPEHSMDEYMPIVYVEPEDINAQAIGLDMAHEANRYTAALRARDTGAPQITGPIVLVQDEGHTPGFLFYVPYYDRPVESAAQRREHFVGLVYAPFVVRKLIAGTLEQEKRRVAIRISDGGEVIYDELNSDNAANDPTPQFTSQAKVDLYGRTWTFDIQSTTLFRETTGNNQPILILIGGITIDALLLTLFIMMTRASRRTLAFADRMNASLKQRTAELTQSNEELERFAFVASHDLRTPLRGIAALAEYLEEDLAEITAKQETDPEIARNLIRIRERVTRMDDLINGIMSYSRVGRTDDEIERFDVGDLLRWIAEDLDIAPRQLKLDSNMPTIEGYRVRFGQVMSNLMSNAIKYNPDTANATVSITCEETDDFYRFAVKDNGPGIDPKFHGRIFEVFQTLQPKDKSKSTGVGLSIVKKSVEALGGQISVSSLPGNGTVFTVDWPKQLRHSTFEVASA